MIVCVPKICEWEDDHAKKLPVYLRVQLQIVLSSHRVHDAVRSIESQLKKLREIDSKGIPMTAAYGAGTESSVGVVESDEELGVEMEDTGVDETDAVDLWIRSSGSLRRGRYRTKKESAYCFARTWNTPCNGTL